MMNPRALLLAAALAFTPVALQAQTQPVDRIAAVVNEDVILQSELDRAIANITAQYASNPGQLPPPEVLAKQVLERLVLTRLQVTRAQESGIRVTDQEIDQAVGNIAQQNNMTPDQLRAQVAKDGLSLADFRNTLRDEITIQRLRQSYAQSRVQVSEGEVDAAIAAQAATGVQYRLAHILVGVPDGASADQISTGKSKIDGVKALVDKGELDFSAAAVRYSDSPNALEGGDLGWRSVDEIPTAFVEMLKGMSPGQVVGPLRGPSGFQLLKLVEVRDAAQMEKRSVTEYNARHILVRVTPTQDAAAAKAKIDTLRARIAGGADFQDVAREGSEDNNTRGQGGDLGWFPADAFGADFGSQVTALADGGVSQPFRSDAGWHIVQRVAQRQTDLTNENRRAQVRETIGRRKLEEEFNRYLQELRGEAYVVFRSGDRAGSEGSAPATPPPPSGG